MTGEVDALHVYAGAPADLDVQQGQADRNAGPAIEHLIEEAVAWIVVLRAVAGKAFLVEEEGVHRGDLCWRRVTRRRRR